MLESPRVASRLGSHAIPNVELFSTALSGILFAPRCGGSLSNTVTHSKLRSVSIYPFPQAFCGGPSLCSYPSLTLTKSAKGPNCEYGPIFDPLRPDSKENLQLQQRCDSGWTSHVTSLHGVPNEETDSTNRFRRLYHCALIHRDTNCTGETKRQRREAIKSAWILVLASD
jgi:hypothetical protein